MKEYADDCYIVRIRTLTSATGDDAFPSLFLGKASHEVIGASDFEAEDLLKIFALEPDLIPKF